MELQNHPPVGLETCMSPPGGPPSCLSSFISFRNLQCNLSHDELCYNVVTPIQDVEAQAAIPS